MSSEAPYSIRKLTVLETFNRVAAIYFDSAYTRLFITLACLMVIPCSLVGMIIINYVSQSIFETNDTDDPTYLLKNWAGILLITGSKLFFHSCAAILSDAAIVYTVAELYCGNSRPIWTTSLNVALGNLHQLFLAGLIIFTGVLIGYGCFVIGGIYVAVLSSLATPVIVVEGKPAVEAIQRSAQLTQGLRWYIVACLTVVFILSYLVSHLLNMLVAPGGPLGLGMWFTVSGSLVNMFVASISVPALAILKCIIYLSIRGEKEGLDADGLARDMGQHSLLSPSEIFEYHQVSMEDGRPTVSAEDGEHTGQL